MIYDLLIILAYNYDFMFKSSKICWIKYEMFVDMKSLFYNKIIINLNVIINNINTSLTLKITLFLEFRI